MKNHRSKIEKLISELCPNGVEFKELGELGVLENTGVDKKIIIGQKEIMLLNYMDVYRNKHIDRSKLKMQVTASDSKIKSCNIEKGDIFITPTSETRDDIGHAAVADETIGGAVYSYHLMRIRLKEKNDITPYFISYLFDTDIVQNQILKLAMGITRFGLTKSKFASIKIPLPPLAIQEEIVKILNSFTELEAELEAELEVRKKQYEYYREELLFNKKYQYLTFDKLCTVNQGLQVPISDRKTEPGENRFFYITVQFLKNNIENFYIENPNESVVCDEDDILVTRTGSTGKIITGVNGCFHNNFFKLNCNKNVKKRYMYHLLSSKKMYNKMLSSASGGTVPDLPHSSFYKISVPIPPIEEQERIVSILDKFDALVNDISVGLPAELSARRSQYEYYRGKLLTFKEFKNNF